MGFLDWLTGKKTEERQNASPKIDNSGITAIGNTEPVCPYCNFRFDTMPQKKKQCPKCENFVRSRTRPFDNKKVLIKEEQMIELERQWTIKNGRSDGIILGAAPEVRQQHSQKLANTIESNKNVFTGIPPESAKKIRQIIADGVRAENTVGVISREIVRQVEGVDRERAITMINTVTMKAVNSESRNRYAKSGIKKLERLVVLDGRTCEKCVANNGKIFMIEEAAAIDAEAHDGCRCTWIPVVDIPE
jgi:SPP1 gp7 family putative phage head morphogenesis protein